MPVLVLLGVLAVGVSLIAAEPRPARAPPRLVMTGNLAAFVSLAPVALARVKGDR